ncbi:hypothetical protein EYZ11_007297 [Aspergillus tanneri]|uniref:Uncharacterized protein n=1 Tax=Aspergillus tanneri TaxID=1220188 RepID=A0A4S3JDS7_9EURO|nr:hypothetical protein EYZ11_007297 [Aspergillus tanneri]
MQQVQYGAESLITYFPDFNASPGTYHSSGPDVLRQTQWDYTKRPKPVTFTRSTRT